MPGMQNQETKQQHKMMSEWDASNDYARMKCKDAIESGNNDNKQQMNENNTHNMMENNNRMNTNGNCKMKASKMVKHWGIYSYKFYLENKISLV